MFFERKVKFLSDKSKLSNEPSEREEMKEGHKDDSLLSGHHSEEEQAARKRRNIVFR